MKEKLLQVYKLFGFALFVFMWKMADSLFGFMHPQLAIGGGPSPQSLGSSGGVIVMKDDVHQNSALKLAKSMKMSLRLTFKVVLKCQ